MEKINSILENLLDEIKKEVSDSLTEMNRNDEKDQKKEIDLLTSLEVCELLRVSRRTITRMVKDGRLRPVSNIGRYLFSKEDILDIGIVS
jgi:excisionase family DNA binding protein